MHSNLAITTNNDVCIYITSNSFNYIIKKLLYYKAPLPVVKDFNNGWVIFTTSSGKQISGCCYIKIHYVLIITS